MKLLAKCLPVPTIQPYWGLKLPHINNMAMANIPTIPVPKDTNAGTKIELQELQGFATSAGDQITKPRIIGSWLLFLKSNEKSYKSELINRGLICLS